MNHSISDLTFWIGRLDFPEIDYKVIVLDIKKYIRWIHIKIYASNMFSFSPASFFYVGLEN